MDASTFQLKSGAALEECRYCGAGITLADDGAWDDDRHACGCAAALDAGDSAGEHRPIGRAARITR